MKNYLQIVMDALALDGEGQNWNSFIDLEAHDRQYHHGHYDGGTCSLRDKLGNATQPGGLLDGMPSLDQFNNIVRQAINSGMIDENGREEINNILNDVANGLQNWEGGDEASVRQSVEEMKELYEGLRDAFAQQVREEDVETPESTTEQTHEQPPTEEMVGPVTTPQFNSAVSAIHEYFPEVEEDVISRVLRSALVNGTISDANRGYMINALPNGDPVRTAIEGMAIGVASSQAQASQTQPETTPAEPPAPEPQSPNAVPTAEQIEHAIDRVMETFPNGSRNEIRDVFNRIANGDAAMARAAHQTLLQAVGADDPVMRFVQGVIDGTQTPNQAEAVQTPQTQAPQPTPAPAQATAAEPVTRITERYGLRNVNECINSAVETAPKTLRRQNTDLMRVLSQASSRTMEQLRREGLGPATRSILEQLRDGNLSDDGRRFLLDLEQAALRQSTGAYSHVTIRVANRINPNWRDGIGTRTVQSAQVEQSEHVPTPPSYDAGQMDRPYNGAWQAICLANRTTISSDKANASKYSLDSAYTGDLYKLEGGAELRRGYGGCNCWKTAAANLIRTRGFNVRPKAEWQNETATQKSEFIKSQTACGKAYENISNLGNEGLRQKLTEIMTNDEKYPNGTAILCWDGHHGTLAIKHGRNLTHCDGWDSSGHPKDFNNVEDFINGYHPGYLGRDTPIQIGDTNPRKSAQLGKACSDYVSANREKVREWRTLMAMDEESLSQSQRDILNTPITFGDDLISLSPRDVYSTSVSYTNAYRAARGSNVNYVPSEMEIGRQMSGPDSAVGKIMGSYVVKPSDQIIPELFMLVQR